MFVVFSTNQPPSKRKKPKKKKINLKQSKTYCGGLRNVFPQQKFIMEQHGKYLRSTTRTKTKTSKYILQNPWIRDDVGKRYDCNFSILFVALCMKQKRLNALQSSRINKK